MAESTYIYRVLKSTWGIYVSLTAELVLYAEFVGQTISTIPGVYLSIEKLAGILSNEQKYLILGTELVKRQLQAWVQSHEPVVVKILEIRTAPTDYQPEGLTCALAGWLAERLQFEYAAPAVYFDKVKNRYIFPFSA